MLYLMRDSNKLLDMHYAVGSDFSPQESLRSSPGTVFWALKRSVMST